jgi:hypothetical protein
MAAARRFRIAIPMLLVACGPSAADLDKLRPAVEEKLAAIEAAGRTVNETAPLAGDSLDVKGPAPTFPPAMRKENALAFGAEHLEDLTTETKKFSLVLENPLKNLASWARKGVLAEGSKPGSKDIEELIDRAGRMQNLRYVLVARTRGGIESKIIDPNWFSGGRWEAEAFLYDLEEKKLLGGIVFAGVNDATVKVDPNNVRASLVANLQRNAQKAARDAFKARFPTATPPFYEP